MTLSVNQKINTPIGAGRIQGRCSATQWIVRLTISEITKTVPSTLTPRAVFSGLWVFDEKELK